MNDTTDGMSPSPPTPPTAIDAPLDTSVRCIQCQHDLLGMRQSNVCPECGTPVADSVLSTMLIYSSPEYTEALHKGVFLIQATIVGSIIMFFATGLASILAGNTGAVAGVGDSIYLIVSVVLTAVSLYGWWRLSEPDPIYTGRDTGQKLRLFVRLALIVQVAIALATLPLPLLSAATASGASASLTLIDLLLLAVALVSAGMALAAFIASMLYITWLGARLPSVRVVKRAKLIIWLGPLLMTVGLLVLIGPLVALVLYWRLLDWVRLDLKQIREEQAHAAIQA